MTGPAHVPRRQRYRWRIDPLAPGADESLLSVNFPWEGGRLCRIGAVSTSARHSCWDEAVPQNVCINPERRRTGRAGEKRMRSAVRAMGLVGVAALLFGCGAKSSAPTINASKPSIRRKRQG